jgi:hypothetical protein
VRRTQNKTGRHASEHDKELAQRWVDVYREAAASPQERICLNPEENKEHHQFLNYSDPEPLLKALEAFAKHGTFEFVDEVGISKFMFFQDYKSLIADGKNSTQAIEVLADKYAKEPRTIQRWLQGYTSKLKMAKEDKAGL